MQKRNSGPPVLPTPVARLLLGAVAIAGAATAVYIPVMAGGFVWDDHVYVYENREIVGEGLLARIWWGTQAEQYYPLTQTTFWLEWRLWADHAPGYHVTNIVLHAIGSVLVWVLLRRLRVPGAWLAGLIFAVHPVNVASVAWISERKNVLSLIFVLAAALAWLNFEDRSRRRWYLLSLGAFLLALLSKTAVAPLPAALLILTWCRRGRLGRTDVIRTVPFFLLAGAMACVTIYFESGVSRSALIAPPENFAARIAGAGWAVWFYLYKAALPIRLSMIYPHWHVPWRSALSYLPGAAILGGLVVLWRLRGAWGRAPLAALAVFVVMLFPALGFIDMNFMQHSLVSDHFQHVAIIAFLALAVGVGWRALGRWVPAAAGVGAAVAVAGLLAGATWQRAGVFVDEISLCRDTLRKNDEAWSPHVKLGTELGRRGAEQRDLGLIRQAERHLLKAVRLQPKLALAHYHLGLAQAELGNAPQGELSFGRALKLEPKMVKAHENLALALMKRGATTEAVKALEEGLGADPRYLPVRLKLAHLLGEAGAVDRAVSLCREGLALHGEDYALRGELGILFRRKGDSAAAQAQLSRAVDLNPRTPGLQNDLGEILLARGRTGEAMRHLREATRLAPRWPRPVITLARVLASHPDPGHRDAAGASALAERACELTGRNAPAVDALAMALAEAGRFAEAAAAADEALALARKNKDDALADRIQARKAMYESRRPYRMPAGTPRR